ncbi:phage tail tape measure protein, partial [Pseudomonas aeruginosa]|uniref:phage tail tape measure protein n=1 Tax=Pseudomonas aeruginosa TaxID=287 RepID=UPI00345911AA
GKLQINDYALALSNGGVQAAGMGVSLHDFIAVLAATSSAFNSGQTAGTAFRMFVNSLTPSTDAAKNAMKDLGLITKDGSNAFYDSQGNLKSQVEI